MSSPSITMLWRYLRPFRARVLLLASLILVGISLQLAAPQAIRLLLDTAQSGGELRLLLTAGILFFIAVISKKVIVLYTVYLGEDLGWAATNQLRADLVSHCMRLDMGFHKLRTPGELIERIDGDVSALADYFSDLVVQVLGNSLLVIGILTLLFLEQWQFGLVGATYAVLALGLLHLLRTPQVNVAREIRQGYADLYGYLGERLAGTEDIRANGGETYVMNRLYPLMAFVTHKRLRQELWWGLSFSSNYMLYVLALVATLALVGYSYWQGTLSIGTAYVLVYYIDLLESPLKNIRRQAESLRRAAASIERIGAFFAIETAVKETAFAKLPSTAPMIQFDGVSFAYKDKLPIVNGQLPIANDQSPISNPSTSSGQVLQSQNVLHDVAFELESGKILGILGRTGSGKTTLTRLLFRLYDVDSGAITLDGVDVRAVSLSDLRRHVGLVTQEVQLFAATIRDNLTLFRNYDDQRTPIDDAQIIAAIETLGLESWFRALPNGLDTALEEGGKGLSAGEAQLLAFTRIFLRDPRLVVLDEASSRLDPTTERLLERAIDRLLQNRTGIIIAHRLGTVQRADDVLILENGRVVENGRRTALAANSNSRFYSLLQTGMEEALV